MLCILNASQSVFLIKIKFFLLCIPIIVRHIPSVRFYEASSDIDPVRKRSSSSLDTELVFARVFLAPINFRV